MPRIATDEAEIHFEEWGEGKPLLLVHGLGMSAHLWVHQVEAFAAHYRLIAVDLRGFGRSSKPRTPGSYAIEALARDVAAVARALELESPHFLGTSMGGFVGQALALAEPGLCRSFVLCHTGSRMSIPPDVLAARVESLQKEPLSEYAKLVVAQALAPGASPELRRWLAEQIEANDAHAYAQVLTEGLRDFDVTERVAAIETPALVLVGALDRVIPPREGRALAARLPEARLVEIEDVGHLSYAERPEAFNAAVLGFLARFV